jgi:hypothetical protein
MILTPTALPPSSSGTSKRKSAPDLSMSIISTAAGVGAEPEKKLPVKRPPGRPKSLQAKVLSQPPNIAPITPSQLMNLGGDEDNIGKGLRFQGVDDGNRGFMLGPISPLGSPQLRRSRSISAFASLELPGAKVDVPASKLPIAPLKKTVRPLITDKDSDGMLAMFDATFSCRFSR